MCVVPNLTPSLSRASPVASLWQPNLFKKAEMDVLNLMTDNIYPDFVKANRASSAAATAPAPAAPAPSGGGCCVVS